MNYPDFYTKIPTIKLYDPLAEFLGATDKGEMEISYLDCVKLAGHSCPTVAGAYLMTIKGLEALYGSDIPTRGSIKIEMHASQAQGVAGVIANVISFILGASGVGGFKGIQGNFSRDNLISYSVPMSCEVKLTRLDINKSVSLSYDPSSVPPDAKMQVLMGKNIQGLASMEEKDMFRKLWQERVEKILTNTALHSQIITIIKD